MDYEFFKWLHLIGLAMLLLSLGAAVTYFLQPQAKRVRIFIMALHGSSLLVLLLSGLSLLHITRVQTPLPLWVYLKILAWVMFGIMLTFVRKNAHKPLISFITILVLAGITISLVSWKPALVFN